MSNAADSSGVDDFSDGAINDAIQAGGNDAPVQISTSKSHSTPSAGGTPSAWDFTLSQDELAEFDACPNPSSQTSSNSQQIGNTPDPYAGKREKALALRLNTHLRKIHADNKRFVA